jgi:hypothetical protein
MLAERLLQLSEFQLQCGIGFFVVVIKVDTGQAKVAQRVLDGCFLSGSQGIKVLVTGDLLIGLEQTVMLAEPALVVRQQRQGLAIGFT